MDPEPVTPVDDMDPCIPLAEQDAPPPAGHPSGMNRAQRREAYERHKAADRARRMALQASQQRQGR